MTVLDPGKQLASAETWPSLPYNQWKDTCATVHRWTQIVGRVRATLSPQLNHWWHTALYVTPRGLTTSPIPYATRSFEIQLDFVGHHLSLHTSDGLERYMALYPRSVADFYRELVAILGTLGIEVHIPLLPHEPLEPVPYDQDRKHAAYDVEYVERFRRILLQCDRVFKQFRGRFVGKCSPVHFWPGSCDLAVTRFSGRRLSEAAQGDFSDSAYELSSAGFWPGSGSLLQPAFYAYTTPAPAGIEHVALRPPQAHFDASLGEYILLYDEVRNASDPDAVLLDFLQSAYVAGADLAKWDRAHLESE